MQHTLELDIESEDEEVGFYNMKLNWIASSEQAETMIEALVSDLYQAVGNTRKPTKKACAAVAAMVRDLLKGHSYKPSKPCGRYMTPESFKFQHVGYKAFTGAKAKMEKAGYVTVDPGIWWRVATDGVGKVTTIWPTSKLIELALGYGITPANRSMHFAKRSRPAAIWNPVRVARERKWIGGKKGPKVYIKVDPHHPGLLLEAARTNRLNAYWSKQVITPDNHHAFYRAFANGDAKDFYFDKGGRICSEGGGYQSMSEENRADIKINGWPTSELDITSCHTRIFCALMDQPIDPAIDPYSLTRFPRDVAKAYAAMLMGRKTTNGDWADNTKKNLFKKKKIDLNQYPIEEVKAAVFEAIPPLAGWDSSPYRWDGLQYIESSIILDTIEILAYEYDVPALPVHDSIIIPTKDVDLARKVLSSCFQRHTGCLPMLKVKG
tara:strand:+ start:60 stop:1367 length:1308 start_codon:yes stop_codon:yes gene_type:complete